jgi:hypothetical protein
MPGNEHAAPPAAPIREVTCVVVQCSGCLAEPSSDDEGYNPHFTSRERAQKILTENYEWRITGDQWLCRACGEKADCDRLGHVPVTYGPTLLADGRTLGATTWCDRCGNLLGASDPRCIPAPEGYPAPEPRHDSLQWDAAALPEGQAIVTATAVLVASLNAAAVAARWDAWSGDQSRRPELHQPGADAQQAAARVLIAAAGRLPADGAAAPRWRAGAWAAFVHEVTFWTSNADRHLSALRLAAELGGHDIDRLRQWVHGDAREAEAILELHGQHEAATLLAELRSKTGRHDSLATIIRLSMSLALETTG